MKSRILLLSTSLFLIFASCKKDSTPAPTPTPTPTPTADANETTNNSISSGNWSVSSWTNNGVETMQSVWNSVVMTYKKEDKNNGSFTYAIIDVTGASQNFTGKYTIQNSGKEINVDGDLLNLSVSGNNLTLDGNFQGTAVIIKAKK